MSSSAIGLRPMLPLLRGAAAVSILLCLVWASAASWAQSDGTAGPDQRYPLSGTVVNSLTGEPIRRARVEFHGVSSGAALTDGTGQFHFDGVAGGAVQVSVQKPGFFDERELGNGAGQAFSVRAGPGAGPLTLKLVPQAVVVGRVETLQREPIENLPVRLIAKHIIAGRLRWEEVQGSTTNDEGEFRIANLRPGTYYLEFGPGSQNHYLKQLAGQGSGYPALFYPGVSELSAATPVELGPGHEWNADVSLKSVPLVTVTGTAVGVPGDGNAGVAFIDQLGNNVSVFLEFDPTAGKFRSALPAGSYTLIATAWVQNQGQWEAVMPLNLTADLADLRLVLAPVRSVPILVTSEGVRGRGQYSPARGSVSVHLTSETGFLQQQDYWAVREGNPNHPALVVNNLPPGKYSVEVSANGPWYVQSARCGDIDLLRDDLTVADGAQLPPIEVSLRDDGASLSGQVRLVEKEPGTTVLLVPEHSSSVHPQSIRVSEDGSFALGQLAPGNYDVLAFDHADGLEYSNPGVLSAYLSKAVHLTLNPGERRRITLDVLKAAD